MKAVRVAIRGFVVLGLLLALLAQPGFTVAVYAAPGPPAPINQIFPDPVMAEYIRSTLGKASVGDIVTQEELDMIENVSSLGAEAKDISGIEYLRNLHSFSAHGTQIENNISVLKNNIKLRWFQRGSSKMWGDIGVFANFPQMEQIHFSHSGDIYGNIYELRVLPNLTYVSLEFTNVQGDISAFANAVNMEVLWLTDTYVEGSVDTLSQLIQLRTLHLTGLEVTGHLSTIANFHTLGAMSLESTSVTGDLSELTHLTSLRLLHLSYTNIKGDVASLQNMQEMWSLSLRDTEISGNLSSLGRKENLVALGLEYSRVSGTPADRDLFPSLESFSPYNLFDPDAVPSSVASQDYSYLEISYPTPSFVVPQPVASQSTVVSDAADNETSAPSPVVVGILLGALVLMCGGLAVVLMVLWRKQGGGGKGRRKLPKAAANDLEKEEPLDEKADKLPEDVVQEVQAPPEGVMGTENAVSETGQDQQS